MQWLPVLTNIRAREDEQFTSLNKNRSINGEITKVRFGSVRIFKSHVSINRGITLNAQFSSN